LVFSTRIEEHDNLITSVERPALNMGLSNAVFVFYNIKIPTYASSGASVWVLGDSNDGGVIEDG
jgi:hypothetical protein